MDEPERIRTERAAVVVARTINARQAALTAELSRAVWTLVRECGWSVTTVSRELGMSRPTVYSHLRWVDALDVPKEATRGALTD